MQHYDYGAIQDRARDGLHVIFIEPVTRDVIGGVHFPITNGGHLDAPGACNQCRAGQRGEIRGYQWGQGHFLCSCCPDELLWAETQGLVFCQFDDNKWKWYLA